MTAQTTSPAAEALGLAEGEIPDPDRIFHVHPSVLVIRANIRVDVRDDPEFAASVRERGVLQPITCYISDTAGELVVHMGQRRAVFAAEVGRRTVPVLVIDQPEDVDRISDQVVENDQRAALSTSERTAAVQQLAAFGLPADQIAKRAVLRRADVDHALAVAASATAAAAAAEYPLDLEQAAAVAEFEDDDEVVEALTTAAVSGGFDHVLQAARDERRDADEKAAAAAKLRATGLTVLDERPPTRGPAEHLVTLSIKPGKHTSCPGHAAYLIPRYEDTGTVWLPLYVCTDYKAHGHRRPGAEPAQGGLDDAAKAAERATVERLKREWSTAQSVRRRWLRTLTELKTPPASAEKFVVLCLLRHYRPLFDVVHSNHQQFRDLMGLDRAPRESPVQRDVEHAEIDELIGQIGRTSAKRVVLLLAVLMLAAWEERLPANAWRFSSGDDAFFLGQMIEWGYEPSPIERRMLTEGATPP